MAGEFIATFSPRSMIEIAHLAGFGVFLTPEMAVAMQQAGDMLTADAQAKTWQVFAAPTGTLASTITPVLNSPYEVQVQVNSPYGARREYGFSGHVDSLGRHYVNDPAKPYLEPTFVEDEQKVMTIIEDAVNKTLDTMVIA